MKNDPHTAALINSELLASLAAEVERLAETLRECENCARQQKENALAIYYFSSAEQGLKRLATFVKAADDSRRQAQLGRPYQPGQLKPRSTAAAHQKNKGVENVAEPKDNYRSK